MPFGSLFALPWTGPGDPPWAAGNEPTEAWWLATEGGRAVDRPAPGINQGRRRGVTKSPKRKRR